MLLHMSVKGYFFFFLSVVKMHSHFQEAIISRTYIFPFFLYKCVIEILTDICWCCGHIFYSTALISMSTCKFAIKQPLQHSYLEALAKMAFTIFTHESCYINVYALVAIFLCWVKSQCQQFFLLVAKDIYELTATTQTSNCLWKITQTSISWAMQNHIYSPGISPSPAINSKKFLDIWYAFVYFFYSASSVCGLV